MAAIIKDIRDPHLPLPEFLVLDASLVLELQPPTGRQYPKQIIAQNFLSRLSTESKNNRTFPLLPILALEECYFKICQRFYESYCQPGEKWHSHYKQFPNKIKNIMPALNNFKTLLDAIPVEIIEPEDLSIPPRGKVTLLSTRLLDLIDKFCVLPKDATILSDAERLGVFSVATMDGDWNRADGFVVYTIP
ncbi:MAG: hypothetical protein P4L50_23695 [Anaerolineaceae bacterium]|nr:hypothetical protein [Anaerolineaceae bacterium]